MSERRRRRLAEEQRRAQEHLVPEPGEWATDIPPIGLSTSADTPPVAYEPPPAPIPVRRRDSKAASAGSAYLIAGVASALWVGGVAAWFMYEFGAGAVELEPLRLAVYALIALAPAGLAITLANAVRQGASLAVETRRARELSEALVAPTALAAQQTGEVLHSLRHDIDQASLAAERARNDMALLREALSQETLRLNEAAETAGLTARRLVEQLGGERTGMQALGVQLDTQASGVIEAVERQSRMVIDASDLA
ncbi:MAG TPA: tipN, partial [Brevundimonas sp.]|nr:tipN [Brevundimonas sp.]